MKKIFILISLLVIGSLNAIAQTPAATPKPLDIGITATLALGDVTAMNAEQKNLSLKTKDGDITIVLSDATVFQKASPANPTDLTAATPATLADIGVGDRLIASGKVSEDKKTLVSRRVILMTKSDIAKRLQAENDAWKSGINGKVVAVDPVKRELTVTVKGIMGDRSIVVGDTDKAVFRRYSSDSVRYSDAQLASFEDVKTGDQLRARGTRSGDGARFAAEEIISGSFRTAGGVITAIDVAKNEVTINDVVTKKPVTIALSSNTTLRKFPLEMAQRYVMFQAMAASGQMPQGGQGGGQRPAGAGTPQGGQAPQGNAQGTGGATPQQGTPGGQGGQGGMVRMGPGGGAGRGDFDEMLERLPTITLADLKVGEAIAVSSTPGKEPGRVVAIKLLAGVEPFLNAPQISVPGAGRQSSPSINIPGLDGIGGI